MVDQSTTNKFKPIKMVVVGDGGVGKTSLIKRYVPSLNIYLVTSMISSLRSTCQPSSIATEPRSRSTRPLSPSRYGIQLAKTTTPD